MMYAIWGQHIHQLIHVLAVINVAHVAHATHVVMMLVIHIVVGTNLSKVYIAIVATTGA
jgi:hypothetical protein